MFDLMFRVVASLGLIAGLIYWLAYSWRDEDDWLRSVIKTTTLAPLALFWFVTSYLGQDPVWIMALGLGFGVLGDFCLSRPGPRAFLAGMAAFGIGHLIYAAALIARGAELGFDGVAGLEFWAAVALVALVASTEIWLAPRTGALRWPVRAYVVLIAAMGAAAILVPANPGTAELRLGAALFIASDLFLAVRMFVLQRETPRRLLGAVLWPAYVLGQFLLFFGSVLFWTFPQA